MPQSLALNSARKLGRVVMVRNVKLLGSQAGSVVAGQSAAGGTTNFTYASALSTPACRAFPVRRVSTPSDLAEWHTSTILGRPVSRTANIYNRSLARRSTSKPVAPTKTSATEPLPVVFDTSILTGIKVESPSPELQLLQRLQQAGKITLLVPEMAAREWLGQRAEPAQKALDQLLTALKDAQRQPSLSEQPAFKRLLGWKEARSLDVPEISSASEKWHASRLEALGFSSIAFELGDLTFAIDRYTAGQPPYASKRVRKDIPDALVLAGARRARSGTSTAIFVCADERLRKAAETEGMTVAESLTDALKLQAISSLHSNAAFALWWEGHLSDVVSAIKDESEGLDDSLQNVLVNVVAGVTIRHSDLPEDNHEAYVRSAGDFTDIKIEWDQAESLGEGLVSVPLSFETTIDLVFYVYRGDAFDVPDWVSVSYGDFEDDHYFEASGTREARYTARLVLEFPESAMQATPDLSDIEIAVEDAELDDFLD
jgi:hypothetical protein